jgi:methylmalonyl-CoA mutase, N-terminal domain
VDTEKRRDERRTESGIEVKPLYKPEDLEGFDYPEQLGDPGEYPYTRGPYPSMYRGRPWTMRQYAGFGTARETNARFKYLIDNGQTGLSVAFDLPTQMGRDSDHALALGEVGKVGVAIDSLLDMRDLLEGIPLRDVSTSMTINATASILLLLYSLVAEEQGVEADGVAGTTQNDILKEYLARGTYIYPPGPSMRITTDMFAYCASELPRWNSISISGYHIREAGSTAVQELAFTLSNAIAYVEAALDAGLEVDEFAPRLSFFFNAHNDLFQEVAKYRAARRMWAKIVRDRFGATDERSLKLRFHTQTAGSSLTAQQAENNIVRTTVQALAAVLGGTQSLHTNSLDETLALPTEEAVKIALRTQQVILYESGVANSVDPLGGSYYLEWLTNRLESEAKAYFAKLDQMGGMIRAIERGFPQNEIHRAALEYQKEVDGRERIIVGVNGYTDPEERPVRILKIKEAVEKKQIQQVRQRKKNRSAKKLQAALCQLAAVTEADGDLMTPIMEAVRVEATVGEICEVFRRVYGEYREAVSV